MAKRKRLSNKQRWFLNNVFVAGQYVSDALENLRIRPSTLNRWLTSPLFAEHLRMHINHYYLQAHLELARSTPSAISGLAFLSDKSFKHGEVRHACNDILNIHTQLARAAAQRKVQHGNTMDTFGVVLEQLGVISDNNGSAPDTDQTKNTRKNRVLNAKNTENT